jgi:hypothetical protein
MDAVADPLSPETDFEDLLDPPRDWYFTFGSGMRAYVGYTQRGNDDQLQRGLKLDTRYVKINGTWDSARYHMVELFGTMWCDQYEALPEVPGVYWRELPL